MEPIDCCPTDQGMITRSCSPQELGNEPVVNEDLHSAASVLVQYKKLLCQDNVLIATKSLVTELQHSRHVFDEGKAASMIKNASSWTRLKQRLVTTGKLGVQIQTVRA
jgi:hypothetical protein